MKQITKTLQNPYIRMFVSPLAMILFGILYGMTLTANKQWYSALLLVIIVIVSDLINHFLNTKFNMNNEAGSPTIILIIFESVLLVSTVLLMLNSNWQINLLLITYIIYIHIQYMPFNFSTSLYSIVIAILFNGLALNAIGFYTQTFSLTSEFLTHAIPLVFIQAAVLIESNELKRMASHTPLLIPPKLREPIVIGLLLIGIMVGFSMSLPSRSFYIVQILYALLTIIISIPLGIRTYNEYQSQNKLNYASATGLVISLLYLLAFIF